MGKMNMDVGDFLYNKLPAIYRIKDADQNLFLKQFLDVLQQGGFKYLLDSINGIYDLMDINKISSNFLEVKAQELGYDYSIDLPDWFTQRLLSNIVAIYKRKGTKAAVKFIAREMTGFNVDILEMQNRFFRTWNSNPHLELPDYNGASRTFSNTTTDSHYLGYGDKYNYKNYIVTLSAPYETSNLVEKEDAVKGLLNYFKSTHSNIYIVTKYWFQDILNNLSTEDLYVNSAIRDESTEINNLVNSITSIKDLVIPVPYTEESLMQILDGKGNSLTNDARYLLNRNFYTNGGTFNKDIIFIGKLLDTLNLSTLEKEQPIKLSEIYKEDFTHYFSDSLLKVTDNNFILNNSLLNSNAVLLGKYTKLPNTEKIFLLHELETAVQSFGEENERLILKTNTDIDTKYTKLNELDNIQTILKDYLSSSLILNEGNLNDSSSKIYSMGDTREDKSSEISLKDMVKDTENDIMNIRRNKYDECLTNHTQYKTNGSFYTNCKNGYDIITYHDTGKTIVI
jgi:phage tail-like protein